jgi:guanylate kinase
LSKSANAFKSPLIAFSAPSGAGKTTIVKRLAAKYPVMSISVSATTRKMRPKEKHGRDYFFLDKSDFEQAIREGKFLEYEHVFDEYYGTLLETVESSLEQGKVVLFDIDVSGALAVKKHYPQAQLFFIKPPSREALISRLQGRNSETEASIKKRLNRLEYEYQQAEDFDHIIINDDLDTAINEIESIILNEQE